MPKLRPPFRAEHIGSLKRPAALLAKRAATEAGDTTLDELRVEEDKSIMAIIELQREAGIRSITDGEFRRRMFFDGFFDQLVGSGITYEPKLPLDRFMPYVPVTATYRRLGYTHLPSYLCTGKIERKRPLYLPQFESLKNLVDPVEVPHLKLTMCAPEYFHLRHGPYAFPTSVYATSAEYFADVISIYRAELADLYAAGLRNIQFDDPSLAYFCDTRMIEGMRAEGIDPEALFDEYLGVYNQIVKGRPEDLCVGIHLCRGNFKGSVYFSTGSYDRIAVKLFNKLDMDCFYLEYDSERAGTLHPLRHLPPGKTVVLGLVSSKIPELESIDDLKRRVHEAAEMISNGDEKRSIDEALNQICISPQCGFASHFEGNQITEQDMFKKLRLVSEAAKVIWG